MHNPNNKHCKYGTYDPKKWDTDDNHFIKMEQCTCQPPVEGVEGNISEHRGVVKTKDPNSFITATIKNVPVEGENEVCPNCGAGWSEATMIGDPEYNDMWLCGVCKKVYGAPKFLNLKPQVKPTPEVGKTYARDYSHSHCWDQKQPPACGIPLFKHPQCCLCDTPNPSAVVFSPQPESDWEEEYEKLWTVGSIGVESRFGHFSSAKQIQREFMRHVIAKKMEEARLQRTNEVVELVKKIKEESENEDLSGGYALSLVLKALTDLSAKLKEV